MSNILTSVLERAFLYLVFFFFSFSNYLMKKIAFVCVCEREGEGSIDVREETQ